jgi:putative ABC transport system substrate-binding protein
VVTRRSFGVALLAALAVGPFAAHAQQRQRVWRVGYLASADPAVNPYLAPFRGMLRELGYVEGENLHIEYRWWSAGELASHRRLAEEFVRQNCAAILAYGTPAALAAQRATESIPIVMIAAGDPVAMRLVESLQHPDGNVTGVSEFAPRLNAERLGVLHQLVPGARVIALISNPLNASASSQHREYESAARDQGLQVRAYDVRGAMEIDAAFAQMVKDGVDGVVVFDDPAFAALRSALSAAAHAARLPSLYPDRQFVQAGGLVSYGSDGNEAWRNAAAFVAQIFKGARLADLPVKQPARMELAINRATARSLGLLIPQDLVRRADLSIE